MVEAIGKALLGFEAATRRLLLTVKRSCFNGREIESYRRRAEWAEILRISPNLAERIVDLEQQLRENDRSLTALYEQELRRERRHVLDLLQDHRFLRGVALGRPGLVQKFRGHAPSVVASGFSKCPGKWEQSLLRFVTRAAAKLSGNSTLTAYALGSIQSSPCLPGFRFIGSPQREVSLVRLDRPQLEQLQMLLMRHPAVRERAFVAWNDSLEELEPGQYRYLRDRHWSLESGAEIFELVPTARIKIQLSKAVLDATREALRDGALPYDALLALLDGNGASTDRTEELRSTLDQLVDFGILLLLPPWPTYEPRLEQRIGKFLRTLSHESTLRATADALDELLKLEAGFASAPQPESAVTRLEQAFTSLLDRARQLVGHQSLLSTRAHFFEEVLFEPISPGDDQGVFQIAAPAVQEVLQNAELIAHFTALFNHRHDVLHTLAAWWREHEPDRRAAPFLEIARGFAPVWKEFLHFHKTANDYVLSTFSPLRTPAVEELRERRETLLAQAQNLLNSSPLTDTLPPGRLRSLVEALPRRYAPLGLCLFVQPVDTERNLWVLNRLHEGTGRYLSRLTPILEEPRLQRFLDHLVAKSVIELEGEEVDLLEVKYPWDHLVRAHLPQAAKVLDIRGLHLALPQERRVRLEDLTIQADLESETFRVIDASGRRVLPVNLSTLSDAGHPNLLRLLLVFGPGETRGVLPFSHSEGDEICRVNHRLTCGNLVVRRRRWEIDVENLRPALESVTDLQAYIAVDDWRCQLGLPSICFYSEITYHGILKPQYIDFTSPSLCRLFIASLRKRTDRTIIFEEALPSPAQFPLDSSAECRAIELLIDSLASTAGGNLAAGVLNHDGESRSLRKEG